MNGDAEQIEQTEQIETTPFTELELLELIAGALIEFKMFFIAFFMVYVIFKIVRWD